MQTARDMSVYVYGIEGLGPGAATCVFWVEGRAYPWHTHAGPSASNL